MSKPTHSIENPGYGNTLVLENKNGKKSVKYIYPDVPKSNKNFYTPTNTQFPSIIATQNARKMVAEMKEEKERDKRLSENLRKAREKEEQREKKEQREKDANFLNIDDIEFSSDEDVATILEKNRGEKKGGKRKKTKKQSKKGKARSRRR